MSNNNKYPETTHLRRLDLSGERLNRTILSLAVPAILENLMFSMVFFSDMMIVGWLRDENSLAATTLAGLIMYFVNAPFFALSIATASVVSRCWGEHDFDGARRYAGQSILLTIVLAVLLLCSFWLVAGNIIRLLGGTEQVIVPGTIYLRIVMLSGVLGLPLIISNGLIRARGNARTPMTITIIMNLVNIVVSIVLAFGLAGAPKLGLAGVAWGTVVARSTGGILSLSVLATAEKGLGIRIRDFAYVQGGIFARLWNLAFPAMLDRIFHSISNLVFIRIVSILGTTALAAHNIAVNVESLSFMPALGIGAATATIVGQAIGAGQSHIAELTVKKTLLWSGGFMVALGIIFVAFAPAGVVIVGATPEVLKLAGIAIQVSALELPFLASYLILSAALRGAGDTRSPLYVTLVCLFIFRLGAVYLFAITFGWGLAGVWLATAMDWAARTAGLWWFFRAGVWKLIHEKEKARFAPSQPEID